MPDDRQDPVEVAPSDDHWWHVPLYVSARGLTTYEIPYHGQAFDIEHDVLEHQIIIRRGPLVRRIDLPGKTISQCYSGLETALGELDIEVQILARPYECKSQTPFANDTEHASYDAAAVRRAWEALVSIDEVFKQFRGGFVGKCSPVHLFWHSFDLAVTRFSGRPAPPMPEADRVTQAAYTHEVISAAFWFGDDNLPEAAFYCYAFPAPPGIDSQPLAVGEWIEQRGSPMAILRYEQVRQSEDPRALLMDFLESSYRAGANGLNWDPTLVR